MLFRKRKTPDKKPDPEAWMMSYGDMATILLAMFIVLSTLGKDQTGLNLMQGLESWRDSRQFFGLGGTSPRSARVQQMQFPGRTYSVPDPWSRDQNDRDAVLDAEQEDLDRLLNWLKDSFDLRRVQAPAAQATVEEFEPFRNGRLSPAQHRRLEPLIPVLADRDHRIFVVVWASMPSETALLRAAAEAAALASEIRTLTGLPLGGDRLTAVGQPWAFPDKRRPVYTLTLERVRS